MPTDPGRSLMPAATPAPARWPRRAALGSAAAAVAALAVAGKAAATTVPRPDAAGGAGFTSADDAVAAYLGALAAGDFDTAVATWAVEEYVEHFDLEAYLESTRFYLPSRSVLPLPNSDPFNVAINVAHRRAFVAQMVTDQYFALVNPGLDRGATGQRLDEGEAGQFVADLEATMTPAPLADLTNFELVDVAEIDEAVAAEWADPRFEDAQARVREFLGADELADLVVRASVDGAAVVILLRAARYGESWWLETLYGLLAQLFDVMGEAGSVLWLDGPPSMRRR